MRLAHVVESVAAGPDGRVWAATNAGSASFHPDVPE